VCCARDAFLGLKLAALGLCVASAAPNVHSHECSLGRRAQGLSAAFASGSAGVTATICSHNLLLPRDLTLLGGGFVKSKRLSREPLSLMTTQRLTLPGRLVAKVFVTAARAYADEEELRAQWDLSRRKQVSLNALFTGRALSLTNGPFGT
jgi:hypothetical protein